MSAATSPFIVLIEPRTLKEATRMAEALAAVKGTKLEDRLMDHLLHELNDAGRDLTVDQARRVLDHYAAS